MTGSGPKKETLEIQEGGLYSIQQWLDLSIFVAFQ